MSFDKRKWDTIAMQLRHAHSGPECRTRWANHLRPSIKQSEQSGSAEQWTSEEDERLRGAAEARGEREVAFFIPQW